MPLFSSDREMTISLNEDFIGAVKLSGKLHKISHQFGSQKNDFIATSITYFLSDKSFSVRDRRHMQGKYIELQHDDILILGDRFDTSVFFANLDDFLDTELGKKIVRFAYDREDSFLWGRNLKEFSLIDSFNSRKVGYQCFLLENETALLFEVEKKALNEILSNSKLIKSTSNRIKVAILIKKDTEWYELIEINSSEEEREQFDE